jgi:putative phosphoesterase
MFKGLGNTDYTDYKRNGELIEYIEICDKRFMLTHGHTFSDDVTVFGKREQKIWMYAGNTDIVLYGHTHEPFIYCCEGKWIMNPGRVGRISSRVIHATYSVLEIEGDKIQWRLAEVDKIIK